MKGIIEVVSRAEYDAWMAKQKPYYYSAFPEKDPSATPVATPSKLDSAGTPGKIASVQSAGAHLNKLK